VREEGQGERGVKGGGGRGGRREGRKEGRERRECISLM
jgi:hypothetical protein